MKIRQLAAKYEDNDYKILSEIKGKAFQFKTQYLLMFTGTLKFIIKV